MNYECKRCLHKTKQKIEMIRHLNRKNKCVRNNVDSMKYTDIELYELSIKKNMENDLLDLYVNDNDNKLICSNCNATFHNKSNLNRHINNSKCTEKCLNITNNTLNQQNIININCDCIDSLIKVIHILI